MAMSPDDEDDKPTVVLDLKALKKQALEKNEDLTGVEHEAPPQDPNEGIVEQPIEFAVKSEDIPEVASVGRKPHKLEVIMFDLQNEFFKANRDLFPKGFQYQLASGLPELNAAIAPKQFKILVFNYDENPKAINKLLGQIKTKFPHVKTLLMAKSISAEKAKLHSQSASGANAYYQLPLDSTKIEAQFIRMSKSAKPKEA
jgi:hypothetical protein